MAEKPIKFVSDALFKRSIIKDDASGNKIFQVSTSSVNIKVPLSASDTFIDGNLEVSGTVSARKLNITEVNTNVIYDTSISASINALLDVSASDAAAGQFLKYDGQFWVGGDVNLTGAINAVKASQNRLKYQKVDFFNTSGSAEVYLPLEQLGGVAFPTGSLDYIMYDISVKYDNSWIKDMMYSELTIKNDQLCVILDAAALNETYQYKLVVVNNNPEDLIV